MSLFSRQKHAKQKGTALLELALVWPLLSLVLLGVIDFGRIFYASIEVTNAAHAGVQYGARSLTLANDTAGMQTAATNDAVDTSGMTSSANYTCRCPGTPLTVSCGMALSACGPSSPYELYVTVTTQKSVTPMFPWPGIPNPIVVNSTATMRAK
jgi:Flp pilus assembly protein TadG